MEALDAVRDPQERLLTRDRELVIGSTERLDVEAKARRRRAQLVRQRAEDVNSVAMETAALSDVREREHGQGAEGHRGG